MELDTEIGLWAIVYADDEIGFSKGKAKDHVMVPRDTVTPDRSITFAIKELVGSLEFGSQVIETTFRGE